MALLAPYNPDKAGTQNAVASLSVSRAILMVTGGELSGARMYLDIGRTYTLGIDEGYDIVLRGAVLDGSSLQITLNPNDINIVDSASSDSVDVAYHDELNFGSGTFFIVQSDELAKPLQSTSTKPMDALLFNNIEDAMPANAAAAGAIPSVEPNQSHSGVNTASIGSRRFLRPALYAMAIAAISVIVATALSWQGARFTAPVAIAQPLELSLANAGFGHLDVDRSGATIIVSGYVQSRQQSLDLANAIAVQGEAALNRVQVDEEILTQIENVLRVNGVVGLIEAQGNGAFIANTQLAQGSKLDGLQGLIERDVPSVASFSVNNQLPMLVPEPAPEPTNVSVQLDAGKRVVLVNSEKPSYIVTEDQSRYFIGSILPGGYRITDITNGRVLLEKQGKTTELKF